MQVDHISRALVEMNLPHEKTVKIAGLHEVDIRFLVPQRGFSKKNLNVLGTCGKQVMFPQDMSLAKMPCHFGSSLHQVKNVFRIPSSSLLPHSHGIC